jgi:hypothetical protein
MLFQEPVPTRVAGIYFLGEALGFGTSVATGIDP